MSKYFLAAVGVVLFWAFVLLPAYSDAGGLILLGVFLGILVLVVSGVMFSIFVDMLEDWKRKRNERR